MKEQISQCNEKTKDNFKTVQMLDGEVKQNKAVSVFQPPQDQNNLIEILKRQNIVEQLIAQIDNRIFEFMIPQDKEFFDQTMMELNELQFNPSDNSEMQNRAEIMQRIQSLQIMVGKYYSQLEAIKPRQLQLTISQNVVNLREIPEKKTAVFQFSVGRPLCQDSVVYRVKLTTNLNQTVSTSPNTESDFFKSEGKQTMNDRECNHIFPVFLEKSPYNDASILFSIPDFDIQQQVIQENKMWSITLELIKDPTSSSQSYISENSKKTISLYYNPDIGIKKDVIVENISNNTEQDRQKKEEEKQREQLINKEQDKVRDSIQTETKKEDEKIEIIENGSSAEPIKAESEKEQSNIEKQDNTESKNENNNVQGEDSNSTEKQDNKEEQNTETNNRRRMLFQENYGKETISGNKEDGQLSLGKYTKSSNPLDGTRHNPGHGMDNDYYLKVVNTIFENLMSDHTDVYSFTSLETSGGRDFRLPAVSFRYEFDPITVLHYRKSRSITQFIVTLCAIVGGSIALSKYIHTLLVK